MIPVYCPQHSLFVMGGSFQENMVHLAESRLDLLMVSTEEGPRELEAQDLGYMRAMLQHDVVQTYLEKNPHRRRDTNQVTFQVHCQPQTGVHSVGRLGSLSTMGVGRGRVAGTTGSTDHSAAADRCAADLSTAAGSSTDMCSSDTAAGSSTGSSTARSTDICYVDTATGTALADTRTDRCRGLSICWELGVGQLGLRICMYSIDLDGGRGLILGLVIVSICVGLGAVIAANNGLCLGHQRLYDAQPSLDPRR